MLERDWQSGSGAVDDLARQKQLFGRSGGQHRIRRSQKADGDPYCVERVHTRQADKIGQIFDGSRAREGTGPIVAVDVVDLTEPLIEVVSWLTERTGEAARERSDDGSTAWMIDSAGNSGAT